MPNARVRRAAAGSDNTTLKLELRNTISNRSGGQHFDVEKLRDLKVKIAFILQLYWQMLKTRRWKAREIPIQSGNS